MLDRLKKISVIPIFPLPVVLLPGMVMPLHIFEPRYRAMLQHCLVSDDLFGLSHHHEAAVGVISIPEPGSVGCAARIVAVSQLSDGRSNILAMGLSRYTVIDYEQEEPFLLAKIDFFEDDPPPDRAALAGLVKGVGRLFDRFAAAAVVLSDAPKPKRKPPEDAEALSFAVAVAILNQVEAQQAMLVTRSTTERLTNLQNRLSEVVDEWEQRAADHTAVRGNGKRRWNATIH